MLTFNEEIALNLYHQKLNDIQIGAALNKHAKTICRWRKKKGLESICNNGFFQGVHYSTVLNKTQSDEMGRFLITLLKASYIAKEEGVKPDLDSFLKAWRGLPVSEEGKRDRLNMLQREYYRKTKEKRMENV